MSAVHRRDLSGEGATRRWHKRYVVAHAFEAALGIAAAVAGVVYFIDPASLHQTSIGHNLQGLAFAWSALYFLGGLLMVGGLFVGSLRMELAGLCLFIPAMLTQGVAIMLFAGTRGVSPAMSFVAFCVAALLRARTVWHLAQARRIGDPS